MSSTTATNKNKDSQSSLGPVKINSATQNSDLPMVLAGQFRLLAARAGDHPSIHHLLLSLFHQPSEAEFHAQNEEPLYEPTDRLIVKRGSKIISHVRHSKRQMQFGSQTLAVGAISELVTLPEFQKRGFATALLKQAEKQMVEEGAVLGVLRTDQPRFYQQRGWVVSGRHSYSMAGPRDILSHMNSLKVAPTRFNRQQPEVKLNIRLWRHVERAALLRLYEENNRDTYGSIIRSEKYWLWLINREAYDRIYVAIDGPQKICLDEISSKVVGYAVAKKGRIIEMMTSPKYPRAREQILARVCGDSIEQDYYTVRLDAPPDDPLHRIIQLSGGSHHHHEIDRGNVFMVKLLNPLVVANRLFPNFQQRLQAAKLSLPVELGMQIKRNGAGKKYCLSLNKSSATIIADSLPRNYLTLSTTEFAQLLLGHLNVSAAIEAGRIKASSKGAANLAAILFPTLPLWRPPLDDLAAS